MILTQLKAWLWAIVGALLAVLGVTSVYFKNKSERAARQRDTLKATVHAERTRKRVEKEVKKDLSQKEREIKERIKKDEEIDSLSNPNDNW